MENLETPNRDHTLFQQTSLHQLGIALFSAFALLIAISTVPVLDLLGRCHRAVHRSCSRKKQRK